MKIMDKSDLILEKLEHLEKKISGLENQLGHVLLHSSTQASMTLQSCVRWLKDKETVTTQQIVNEFSIDAVEALQIIDELTYLNLLFAGNTKIKRVNSDSIKLVTFNELERIQTSGDVDPLFSQAVVVMRLCGLASAAVFQRKLQVGYARASRILDQLEQAGYIGPADGSKSREILKTF